MLLFFMMRTIIFIKLMTLMVRLQPMMMLVLLLFLASIVRSSSFTRDMRSLPLFFILISGRFRMPSIRAAQEARRADADPLTQSVQVVTEEPIAVAEKPKKQRASPKKVPAVPKLRKEAKETKETTASFIRISADGQVVPVAPIQVIEKEIVFGTDPVQCTQILDDPSISSIHARLRQTDDGGFLLQDNNSIAGTWVNYEPIPREGYRLAHGDMVHFGQLKYRFTLTVPPPVSTPKITVQTIEE